MTYTYAEVKKKIQENPDAKDTMYSKAIFLLEEGREDALIKDGILKKQRRDWIISADRHNNGEYTQQYHLLVHIEFKLNESKIKLSDQFSEHHIKNAALFFWIEEIIFGKSQADLKSQYEKVCEYYKDTSNPINSAQTLFRAALDA